MKEYKFRASIEMTEVGEYVVSARNYEEALEKLENGEYVSMDVVNYILFGPLYGIKLVEDK